MRGWFLGEARQLLLVAVSMLLVICILMLFTCFDWLIIRMLICIIHVTLCFVHFCPEIYQIKYYSLGRYVIGMLYGIRCIVRAKWPSHVCFFVIDFVSWVCDFEAGIQVIRPDLKRVRRSLADWLHPCNIPRVDTNFTRIVFPSFICSCYSVISLVSFGHLMQTIFQQDNSSMHAHWYAKLEG